MFIIGISFYNHNIILTAICSLIIHNLWYALESFSKRIIFFAFNITFFTFLVGRLVVKSVSNYEDIYNNNKFGLDFNNEQIIWNIFVVLFISLLFLYLGYSLLKNNDEIKLEKFKNITSGVSSEAIAFTSKYVFYITIAFNILILIEQARFTNAVGYTELYSSYTSSYPFFVTKLAEMCPVAFFMFLATLPTKRKAAFPIILYLLLGTFSLVIGNRNDFVLNLLIVIIYLGLRNLTDKKEKWFGKKEILVCISIFPFLILLLNAISYVRMDSSMTTNSFMYAINDFFYKQGASANLIGYAQTLTNQLPEGTNYTFGRLIDFLRNNSITQTIFDIPKYTAQTLESALYGNSFADSVSYILSPKRYLDGWGYGSSYVAELFKDFGFIGIAIGNFLLGIILALMTKLFKTGVLGVWVCLTMSRLLLYAPRDTATSFLVTSFSIINIITIVLIILLAVFFENLYNRTSLSKVRTS